MKRRLASLLCIFILGPILPLYVLRSLLQAIVDAIDWATEGRSWCKPFLLACEKVERAFGVDAETEYQNWKRRMRERTIVTPKGSL